MSLQDRIQSAIETRLPAEEAARAAIDAAFAEARAVMERHGVSPYGVTIEFMTAAVDRLWEGADDRATLRAKATELAGSYIDRLFKFIGNDAAAALPPSSAPVHASADLTAAEDEARFVTRLTIDLCITQLRANNGAGRPNVPGAVTQVIGTLQEARRQLAQVRSGETTIAETPAQREAA